MPLVSGKALWTVYFVMFLDVLNFGIVFPLLPSIAKGFGVDATHVGSLATTYSLAQVFCTPLLGRASDRWGRRPVVLVAVLGTSLSAVMTGLADSFTLLIVARMINGASGATTGVANAYVADVTTAAEKAVYMSYISAANSLGIIVGPAVGGVLAKQGFATACYVSAALSAANFLGAAVFLSESRWVNTPAAREAAVALTSAQEELAVAAEAPAAGAPAAGPGAAGAAAGGERGTAAARGASGQGASAAGDPAASAEAGPGQGPVEGSRPGIPCAAWFLYISGFLIMVGFAAFETVTGYYLMDTFFEGDDTKSGQFYGLLFVVAGVMMFLSSVFLYRPARRLCGERLMVFMGVLVRGAGFVLMATCTQAWEFAVACMIQVTGSTFVIPTTSSLLVAMCSKEIYGRALGYSQAFQGLARVAGPMIFGKVYDSVSHTLPYYICMISGFVAAGLIICVPIRRNEEWCPPAGDVEANVETFESLSQAGPSASVGPDMPFGRRLVRSNTVGDDAGNFHTPSSSLERQNSHTIARQSSGASHQFAEAVS